MAKNKKLKLKKLLTKMNNWACNISANKRDFDNLIIDIYGYHYSDVDEDMIIDSVDMGLKTISFEEFDKLMIERRNELEAKD